MRVKHFKSDEEHKSKFISYFKTMGIIMVFISLSMACHIHIMLAGIIDSIKK